MSAPSWDALDARPIPAWFEKAKFGIFIHWGIFSVPAWRTLSDDLFGGYAEWYYASVYGGYRNQDEGYHAATYGEDFAYRDFAPHFTAEHFDAADWAELFRRAGARYVVLTSKHHDGFCMWPTNNPHKKGWNAGDVGPRRDLLGDLTEAVRSEGMRMGLYYSIPEWETHPSHRCDGGHFIPAGDVERFGLEPDRYVDEILRPQWRELNERYGPAVIYTDGGEWDLDENYTRTRELLGWLYSEAPNRDEVVVNDRMHVGMPGTHGDYFSTEYADIDGYGTAHPWEESRGIGHSYGFNRAERLEDYASTRELLELLVRTVGSGGNLLLNVGPRADGTIPQVQRARLEEVGGWLERHGEAIYDTTAELIPLPEGVYATRRGETLYLLANADAGRAVSVSLPIVDVHDLRGEERVPTVAGEGTVTVTLPPVAQDRYPQVLRCTVR